MKSQRQDGYVARCVTRKNANEMQMIVTLKNLSIERYIKLSRMFSKNPSMELSSLLSDLSIKLHDEHNLSYNDIEALEFI